MTAIRSILRLALPALSLVLSAPASALQVLDASDGETLVAKLSQKELTRIAVNPGRIRKVTGNAGELFLEKDDEKGQIFVRPIQDNATKPVNVFITTDGATYALLLQPVDLPADSIVIRPRTLARIAGNRDRSTAYVHRLKRLLLAMANDLLPRELEVRETSREVGLWPQSRFVLTRSYVGDTLVGEKYLLTNLSDSTLVVAEQDFYKSEVAAVSIEAKSLPPQASTNVFIIRGRRHDD